MPEHVAPCDGDGNCERIDADALRDIGLAGLMHDWGMAKVTTPVRDGSKELRESEWLQVQQHPKYTLELISRIEGLPKRVARAAYQVHERCDGSGYPRSAPGSRTHQFAKILSVADVYCALTTARPYRLPLSPYAGMEFMIRKANLGKFDPDLVRLLLGIVTLFPVGTFVSLSDGAIAVVVKGNPKCYSSPIIRLLSDESGDRIEGGELVDLSDDERNVVKALVSPLRRETLLTKEIFSHQ